MTTNTAAPPADVRPPPVLRFRLVYMFYAMSLLAAALATFGTATDGRGWLHRTSDLKKLAEFHNQGLIDMIYSERGGLP